jgi:cell division protein FtsX
MISRAGSALRRTGRILVERPRAALWTTLALTCALLAVGIAGVAALCVDRSLETATTSAAKAGLVVYLGEGVTDARAQQLTASLQALSGIERVELVAPAESARRLVRSLGSGATLLEGVDVEALPASVEITLAPGVRDVVAMSPIVRELRGTAGVADVVVEDAPQDDPSPVFGAVRAIAWTVAALFAGLALITALASIRVRLDANRREYGVVEMLGGAPSFLVIPTALAGAVQGLFAAVLAGGLLVIGLHVYGDRVPFELVLPSALMLGAFVAGGMTIGLVGGGLAGISRASAR